MFFFSVFFLQEFKQALQTYRLWTPGTMRLLLYIGLGLTFLSFLHECQTFLLGDTESLLSKIMKSDSTEGGGEVIAACPICQMVLNKLLPAVKSGHDINMIARDMTMKCVELNIAPAIICNSIIPLFKDMFFTVLKMTPLNFLEVCGQLLGHKACNLDAKPFTKWDIQLPNKSKPLSKPQTPKLDNPTVRILHLTDIHYDPLYTEGAKVVCPYPICCRRENGMAGFKMEAAGKFGHSNYCDLPKATLVSLFKHLSKIQNQFDIVILTGDLPPHDIWKQTKDDHLHILHEITEMFRHFLPTKKVFFSVGNHESIPVNNFPPPYIKSNGAPHWLYPTLAKAWSKWLPSETKATIEKGAFYSVSPFKGLRIISLNTNFCYRMNFWLLVDSVDPAGQLKWLVTELQKAENHEEKVYIIGHVPPGDPECLSEWQRNYFKILSRYENTVVAQFFGHTHTDSFQVSYNHQSSQPETIAYIAGSVTPHIKLNPGFRIYHIDADRQDNKQSTWSVVDHENYILNITEANISKRAQWKLEYSAKKAYKMTSLLPGDWDKVIKKMQSDENLFQTFYRNYHKSYPVKKCSLECKKRHFCALRFHYFSDSVSC